MRVTVEKSIMLCQRPKITLFYCQNHTILCLDRFKACCYLFSSYCRLFFYFCQKTKRMLALSVATKTNWFFITADPLKFVFAVDLTNFQLKSDQTEQRAIYSAGQKKCYKDCFMKQKCQVQMVRVQYKIKPHHW